MGLGHLTCWYVNNKSAQEICFSRKYRLRDVHVFHFRVERLFYEWLQYVSPVCYVVWSFQVLFDVSNVFCWELMYLLSSLVWVFPIIISEQRICHHLCAINRTMCGFSSTRSPSAGVRTWILLDYFPCMRSAVDLLTGWRLGETAVVRSVIFLCYGWLVLEWLIFTSAFTLLRIFIHLAPAIFILFFYWPET